MNNDLLKISELGLILNYLDSRSIEAWCSKNTIPIIAAGKQKYVSKIFVENYFKESLSKFIHAKFPTATNAIIEAIESNDSIRLSEIIKDKEFKRVDYPMKACGHSKIAQEFLASMSRNSNATSKKIIKKPNESI